MNYISSMLESVNDDWKRIHTSTLSRASLQSIAKASIGETLTGRLIQAVAQNVRKDVSQVVAEAAKYARRTRSSKITMDHLLFALEELNISLDLLHVNYAKPDPIEADKPISKPPIKKSSINRVSRKYSKIRKREREEQYEPYDSNAPLEERKRWLKRERVLLMSNKRFPLSKEQQELYLVITEACMGSSESARREALQSLRTDSSLQPMLYRLSLFICEAIKVNVAQQNFALLIYLMRMVQNLLANPHLQLHNYLHLLVPSLLSCAVTRQLCPFPKAQDQLAVREYATTVMADLIRAYGYLGNDILSRVISVYKTGLKSSILMTIYGSLIGLGKMGKYVIRDCVIPEIRSISEVIEPHLLKKDPDKYLFKIAKYIRHRLLKMTAPILKNIHDTSDDRDEYTKRYGYLGNTLYDAVLLDHFVDNLIEEIEEDNISHINAEE
ncbi:transcription initiation factor TFIID subunit 6 [Drosophila navojoa]|uniref:transcription initiation factor TFIID subunit 6 n=1 Tax=Drosophila navojoa TaxID=7232 RepID=UPI000846BADA|nr:transcription initiation factor TFIID subunit 6 [Drosophila navojoa]